MKKSFLSILLAVAILLTGCSANDPNTEDVYQRGNLYTWNGSAYQLVNTNLGGVNFVPYSGATQNVDLGTNNLTASGLTDSSLAKWSVVTVDTGGELIDNANLTYSGGHFQTNAMSLGGVATGKVLVVGIGVQGTVDGTTNFTLDVATNTLTIPYPKWTDNTSMPVDSATPVAWLPVKLPDGTTAYIPAYK